MDGHDHDHAHGHDHAHDHDHAHEDVHAEEPDESDISAWAASAPTTTCPACGAAGAVTLGGGVFCPTCGEISTNPGYQPPPAPAED